MSETTLRCRRGRPRGSSKCAQQDAASLARVADLLLDTPRLSAADAIRQVTGRSTSESQIYRLRRKLRAQRTALLAAAQERKRVAATRLARHPQPAWNSEGRRAAWFANDFSYLAGFSNTVGKLPISTFDSTLFELAKQFSAFRDPLGLGALSETMKRLSAPPASPLPFFEEHRRLLDAIKPLAFRFPIF